MMHISFPLAAMLASLALAGTAAHAQQVYRIVGPDGKVTFSDRAPDTQLAPTTTRGGGAPAADAALPYELRQVATRYPVTLYTSNDCQPCNSARNLLIGRGVPFSERTITTSEDVEAFKRLSGGTSLPFGTIGAQQLQGFSDAEWTQYLDLAGYPKQSQLPAAGRCRGEKGPGSRARSKAAARVRACRADKDTRQPGRHRLLIKAPVTGAFILEKAGVVLSIRSSAHPARCPSGTPRPSGVRTRQP